MLQETFVLANGVKIPKIGYGTWLVPDVRATGLVKQALALGYRHIDTAQAYGNEAGVGEGIRSSGIPREEIFLTTKLAAEIKDYQAAKAAIDESLRKLNCGYIDLMLIHSPKPWANFQEDNPYFDGNLAAWRALTEAYEAGKLKAIGVSNFEVKDLENIIHNSEVKPHVNQVLAHIGHLPSEVIDFDYNHEILTEAYSPIAHGAMMKDPMITKLADKYQVSIPQLAIRFLLQAGLLPLPKTENPEHMKNNSEVDFVIAPEDMASLKAVPPIDYGEHHTFPVFSK